jgi:hypothetical protein
MFLPGTAKTPVVIELDPKGSNTNYNKKETTFMTTLRTKELKSLLLSGAFEWNSSRASNAIGTTTR